MPSFIAGSIISFSKTLGKARHWTQSKLQQVEHITQSIKDSIKVARRENVVESALKSETKCQLTLRTWKPQLQNFKITLKENAVRAQKQLSYRSGLNQNTFFRYDFIWRRARNAHLIAFGGLFLFQEENLESVDRLNHQFEIYDSVCSHIKTLFGKYTPEDTLLKEKGSRIKDYLLENIVVTTPSSVTYEANIKPDEDDFIVCDDFSECDSTVSWLNGAPWDVSIHCSEDGLPQYAGEFSVKVFVPFGGIRKAETIVRHHESELICCGRGQFGSHVGMDGKWPRKKLPRHPNVITIERAFIGEFNLPHALERHAYDSLLFSLPTSTVMALFLVTKRYKMSLKQFLEGKSYTVDKACIIMLQVLEAVAFLQSNNVVHRSINSESVLLDWDNDGYPYAVLSGFENSFCAESWKDLKVPFQHKTLDSRVGNLSMQAPEISRVQPGYMKVVNYQNSDSWSVGVLAFEMLTGRNLFRDPSECGKFLDSRVYTEQDLPSLENVEASDALKGVVTMLMQCNGNTRLTASEAADILHLELFASPPSFNMGDERKCETLRSWLIAHCSEVLARKQRHSVLYQVCRSFLARIDAKRLSNAFRLWMLMKNMTDG